MLPNALHSLPLHLRLLPGLQTLAGWSKISAQSTSAHLTARKTPESLSSPYYTRASGRSGSGGPSRCINLDALSRIRPRSNKRVAACFVSWLLLVDGRGGHFFVTYCQSRRNSRSSLGAAYYDSFAMFAQNTWKWAVALTFWFTVHNPWHDKGTVICTL